MRIDIKRLLLAMAVVMATLVPGEAPAQPQPQMPPPVVLNVPLELQQTPVWCWAAVTQMAIEYRRGSSLEQCQILERVHGLPPGACCMPPMLQCAHAAQGLQDIQRILLALGGVMSDHTPPLQPMQLYSILRQGDPVIVHIMSSMVSSHVVIARGMRFQMQAVMTPFGPSYRIVPIVLVNDPLSFIPSEVPYERFSGIWMDALIVGGTIQVQTPSTPPNVPAPTPMPIPGASSGNGDFCAKLNRIIAAAPTFAGLRDGPPDYVSDTGDRSYRGTISIMRSGDCSAWANHDGNPYYRCDIFPRGSDCDDAEETFDRFVGTIRSCLSAGWQFDARQGGTHVNTRSFSADGPGMPEVSLTRYRYTSSGNCHVALTVERSD